MVSKYGGLQNPEDLDVSDDSFDGFLHDVNKPHDLATSQYDMISMYLNFVSNTIDRENSHFFVETNLPTPIIY